MTTTTTNPLVLVRSDDPSFPDPPAQEDARQILDRQIPCGGDLSVSLQSTEGVLILALNGAVASASRLGLYAVFNDAFAAEPSRMVIDGSGITGCDEFGLATFIDAGERAADSDIPFAMSGLDTRHRRMLRPSGGSSITENFFHPTLKQALAAVADQPARNEPSRQKLLENLHRLHRARSTTRIVEQATGVVMAYTGLDADAALELLHGYAKTHDVEPLTAASRVIAVVAGGPVGESKSIALDDLLGTDMLGTARTSSRDRSSVES